MDQGATQQFTATVAGSANTAVVWSIQEGSAGGNIDGQGIYTAPAVAGVFHVIATSAADSTKKATAEISVNWVAIGVSPTSGDMEPGATQQFTATVTGSVNHAVTWSVQEGAVGGSITTDGMYTAPASPGRYHVLAKQASITASATLTVATLAVLISPRGAGLLPGSARTFTASVAGCMDDRVTWAVQEGSAGGIITTEGVYTAPATLGEYHVVATSVAHSSVSGIATVVVANSGFTDAGNMTVVRYDHTATLLPSGDVLLAGGGTITKGDYSEAASAELFDHSTGGFRPTGEMTTARRWHTGTLLPNGKVLVAGGGVDGGFDYFPVDSAELYDPATGQFAPAGKMQSARLSHTATLLADGKVLIAGGYRPDEVLATAELYDPATGAFTPTGSMKAARLEHTATLLPDRRVLVAGGWGWGGMSSPAEIYDPSTGVFVAAASFQRDLHSATLLDDGRVLIAGGYWREGSEYKYYDDAVTFSPVSGQFSFAANMSDYRMYHTATKLPNGQVLLAGGLDTDWSEVDTADLFDPATPTCLITGSMAKRRSEHTATLLQDGRVLVAGGVGEKSAELYTQQH
ncbi:MAG TPA: kelch repeat-containing protein [Terriglobales bacterium]